VSTNILVSRPYLENNAVEVDETRLMLVINREGSQNDTQQAFQDALVAC
jgi:hypothetical protein